MHIITPDSKYVAFLSREICTVRFQPAIGRLTVQYRMSNAYPRIIHIDRHIRFRLACGQYITYQTGQSVDGSEADLDMILNIHKYDRRIPSLKASVLSR